MKTTKWTMGALAFLAAFIMVASVMAPLADAGAADSSAPVLFSESDEDGSVNVLGTWTNEDGITVDYIKTANSAKYALKVSFDSNFPLSEFVSVKFNLPGHLDIGINAKDIISDGGIVPLKFEPIDSPLESKTHILTISDDSKIGTDKVFTIELSFSTSLKVVGSGYNEKSDDAKDAINGIWEGSKITDIDNRTMYMIYNQTGMFDNALVGKLYFDGKEIYAETLNTNTPGQHIWYFSFAEGAPAKISDKYAPGEYTMKLFAGEEVVAEATAEIPVPPIVEDVTAGYNEKSDDAKDAINGIWEGSKITDIDNRTMYMIYNQTGMFDNALVGKLYFDGKEIYAETLNTNTPGQHIWYFSFAEGAPAKISDKYAPGEYTMKLFAGEEVVAEATAEIKEQPDLQFKIFVESVETNGKVTGFKTYLFALSGKLPVGSIKLTYEYAVEFEEYVGVMPYTSASIAVEGASYYCSTEMPCIEGHMPVSAYAVFEYEDGSSTKTVQSETILVWGQA